LVAFVDWQRQTEHHNLATFLSGSGVCQRPVAPVAPGLAIDGRHPLPAAQTRRCNAPGSPPGTGVASKELHGCGDPAIACAHLPDASTAQELETPGCNCGPLDGRDSAATGRGAPQNR